MHSWQDEHERIAAQSIMNASPAGSLPRCVFLLMLGVKLCCAVVVAAAAVVAAVAVAGC